MNTEILRNVPVSIPSTVNPNSLLTAKIGREPDEALRVFHNGVLVSNAHLIEVTGSPEPVKIKADIYTGGLLSIELVKLLERNLVELSVCGVGLLGENGVDLSLVTHLDVKELRTNRAEYTFPEHE